jgi:hypothetical protein
MVLNDLMSKRELKAYEKLEKERDVLNAKFSVGEAVSVVKDDGSEQSDKITSEFSIMSGQVVAWLKINRCYIANRVYKLPF